jgi:hypothetical protein
MGQMGSNMFNDGGIVQNMLRQPNIPGDTNHSYQNPPQLSSYGQK